MSKHLFPITLLTLLWTLMLPLGATPRASLITCGQSVTPSMYIGFPIIKLGIKFFCSMEK